MKKKILCITLTLMLLLPLLAACAPSDEGSADPTATPTTGTPATEEPGSEELDPVTLLWHIGGRPQRDEAMVMEELNAYLKEKINAEIDMRFTMHADYQAKMSTVVGSGEEYDLAYVSTTFFNPVVNAQNGAFIELDELLPEYAPNLLKEVPEWVIDGAKIAGHIYIIPSYKDVADVFSFIYNKSLSDDLGLDLTGNWKTIFDLEERFYEFKEARDAKYPEKADIPMMTAYRTMGAWLPSDILMGAVVANIEGIETFEGKGKGEMVFNQYDTEEYREMMRLQRQLVDDGIVAYDTKNYDPDKVREKSGDTAIRLGQGLVAVDDHYYSDDWVVSLVVSDYSIPSTAYLHAAGTAVSVTSKNPERAVMLQDLVYSDQYVATTMRFGLEGEDKHYVIDENGRLDVSKGLNSDPSDRGFYRWYGAESGNLFKAILPATQPADLYDAIQASNDNAANFTSNLGFVMSFGNNKGGLNVSDGDFIFEIIDDLGIEHERVIENDYEIVICNFYNQSQLKESIISIKRVIEDYNVILSIGNTYDSIRKVPTSYREALESTNYRTLKELEKVVEYSEVDSNASSYYYPLQKENTIIIHLTSGIVEKAYEVVDDLIDFNIESRKVTINAVKQLFSDIDRTVQRVAEDMDICSETSLGISEEFNFSNIDEMKLRLKNKFDALCKVIVEKREKNSDEFDKSILEYIDQSYTDSNLSLSTLSELFNLSESHLSRSFKEKFGVNYLDYVNKKRVEYALDILKNSDSDINEIAQKAGFNNDVTFRRLFKKYYGTSPLKYKEAFLKGDA